MGTLRSAPGAWLVLGVVAAALVTACSGAIPSGSPLASLTAASPTSPTEPAKSTQPSVSTDIEGRFDVGGRTLWITCRGSGSPTVVFEAGLGGSTRNFEAIRPAVAAMTRSCLYDRASLGSSQPRAETRDSTAGAAANDLIRLLDAAAIDGPVVLVGHSYGGMIVRLAADRHPEAVRGLVLIDSSSAHQFRPAPDDAGKPWMLDPGRPWRDGTTIVDHEGSAVELDAIRSLGSIPLAVLTQGQMNGPFEVDWSRFQDELAGLSSNALHVVARDAGHMVQDDAPDLTIAVITAVVTAARGGTHLPACDAALERVGGTCLASTLTARLASWEAVRAAVRPVAGPFPSGTYRAELTGEQSAAVTGSPADFRSRVFTWTVAGGRWTVRIVTDGGAPEVLGDVYAATGQELIMRLPHDWRMAGSPGVNRLIWTRTAQGAIRLDQVDDAPRDDSFVAPWTRIGDAPGG